MRKYLTALCCIIGLLVHGQKYIIRHDVLSDETRYYRLSDNKRDTMLVKNISMKKQVPVNLVVTNFNPFYWGAKVSVNKTAADDGSGSAGSMNPFGAFAGLMRGLMPANFPSLDLEGGKSRGLSSAAQQRLVMLLTAYSQTYSQIKILCQQFNSLKNVEWKLNQLKYDNKRNEADIKRLAHDAVQNIIPVEQLSPDLILDYGSSENDRASSVADSFELLRDQILVASKGLDGNMDITEDKSLNDVLIEVNKGKIPVETFAHSLTVNPTLFSDEIFTVGKLHSDIINTPFVYSYNMSSDPDISEIKLSMYAKLDSLRADTMVSYFPVQNHNTIRLRTSIGFIFSRFPTAYNYFSKSDSSIGKAKGNLFVPAVGTFINFYRTGRSGLKWGGTVGFGMPLQGETKDFHFLLGLCFIPGRNEPIVISAGVTGAKVQKLRNGWEIGEKVAPENFNSLTTPVYDIGYYLSVSLNLGTLQQRK